MGKVKRFIAREWLIILGFAGATLIIGFICFRVGVIEKEWFVTKDEYGKKFLGAPIYEITSKKGILELKEPFIPKTKNWEKEYENIVSRGEWKKIKRKKSKSDPLGLLQDDIGLFEIDWLRIARPGDLYEYYPYMIWSAIVAYIGFWFIRSIIWAVQALKKE
jgi:hypothetical protein